MLADILEMQRISLQNNPPGSFVILFWDFAYVIPNFEKQPLQFIFLFKCGFN